jgi:malto-oligosyltrehalose trehalohydrolase
MRRSHSMPFGAELAGGAAAFRLWAPACESVQLLLGRGTPRAVAMQRREGGWHEARVENVSAGTAYAFRVDDGDPVPDPASRANPWDVNGPSVVVDPGAFEWTDGAWRGRPWHEAVVYELHVGTFTPEGTFSAAIGKLDHLARAGVTVLEIMPVADFAGSRNWGYDGVLPFAPDASYGTPEDFKRLVNAAHERGLAVLLDVVYNHFGPEGNHLHRYAPQFFNEAHQTPWGAAINFDGAHRGVVRDFFRHNALYWIEEFHLDGLRMDAVHAIADDSGTHIVREIAAAIAQGPGRERHVHLVLENERNDVKMLERGIPNATAQWNDPWHHCVHVLFTGETDGYYGKFAKDTGQLLARSFGEGFSAALPHGAFMPFLQNHDQVGNRALGERLATLAPAPAMRLAMASLLLMPQVPLLFMGEEINARTPFLFFTDFHGELADAVREGRRKEFSAFPKFASDAARAKIPDPNAESTFAASKIDWNRVDGAWLARFTALLQLRASCLVPRLEGAKPGARFEHAGPGGVSVDWTLGDGSILRLRANFSAEPAGRLRPGAGATIHTEGDCSATAGLGPWSGVWTLEGAR